MDVFMCIAMKKVDYNICIRIFIFLLLVLSDPVYSHDGTDSTRVYFPLSEGSYYLPINILHKQIYKDSIDIKKLQNMYDSVSIDRFIKELKKIRYCSSIYIYRSEKGNPFTNYFGFNINKKSFVIIYSLNIIGRGLSNIILSDSLDIGYYSLCCDIELQKYGINSYRQLRVMVNDSLIDPFF